MSRQVQIIYKKKKNIQLQLALKIGSRSHPVVPVQSQTVSSGVRLTWKESRGVGMAFCLPKQKEIPGLVLVSADKTSPRARFSANALAGHTYII